MNIQLLTKRLTTILQESFFSLTVYKKNLFVFIFFLGFCSSYHLWDDQVVKKKNTIFIFSEVQREDDPKNCTKDLEPNKWYFFLNQKTENKDVSFLTSEQEIINAISLKTELDIKRFQELRNLYKEKKICFSKLQEIWKYERELSHTLMYFYFLNIENELNLWFRQNEFSENQKKLIKEDFKENTKSILEVQNYYLYFFSDVFFLEESIFKMREKEIYEKIKRLNQTYYTLVYHFFYNLPEAFKKEWFKKYKNLPN